MTTSQRRGTKKKVKDDSALIATEKSTVFNDEEFRALVQGVELRDLFLCATNASLTAAPEKNTEGNGELIIKPIQTLVKRTKPVQLYCGVRFNIEAKNLDDIPLKLDLFAEYGIFYDLPENLVFSSQTAGMFARRNAVFNAWPFFRELVHSIVGKMNIPAIILPSFRLPLVPP